ncbi:MAG TPA: c-type cytochrome [Bryobacteraceae bacterium]|nr:c-type cytochrome [Bryobacteraceae bacterium]
MPSWAFIANVTFCATLAAQHGSNPAVVIDTTSEGALLFRGQCANCHGIDGAGAAAGPALNTGTFKHGGTDEAIVATISKGVPGTTMPSFSFDASQMWKLLTHVRSLRLVRASSDVPGDGKAGEAIFRSNCAGCHTPSGAYIGPDLDQVSRRLAAPEIREGIVNPNASVAPPYWSVTARTHSGQTINGIRMNEDTSSIQVRLRDGKLISLLKKDLASFDIVRTSPMPSFQGKLSNSQVSDLVAYLIKGAR